MLYEKKGDRYTAEGKTFTVGGNVFANKNSVYAGLFGTVTEIRTGADRETDNDTPDICCAFIPPESSDMVSDMEQRFSGLYRSPKKIGDLALDCVIMAPSMLEPIPDEVPDAKRKLYFLSRTESYDSGFFHDTIGLSLNKGMLIGMMRRDLEAHDVEMVLSEVREDKDSLRFVYEAREFKVFNYLHYTIADAPVLGGGAE